MRPVILRLLIFLTVAIGAGSLLLFTWFLLFGTPWPIDIVRSDSARLAWDSLLCLVFFIQHSGMIRRSAKERMAKRVPAIYQPALYSIASGLALFALILLWQPTSQFVFHLHGPGRWLSGCIAGAAIAGFIWGTRALGEFDPFGTLPLKAALGGARPPSLPFVAGGPYRYVRHPLYLFMLLLIWSTPRLSTDQLLFNMLWTIWIIVGTWLEERDLLKDFGQTYREYQLSVPMLLPLAHFRAPGRQTSTVTPHENEKGRTARRYASVAAEPNARPGHPDPVAYATALGYSPEELQTVPAGAVMGLGCGTPVARANLCPGEIVLDLGAGGGLDAFLAARRVGLTGRVIGVDATPQMVERANATAKKSNFPSVEFKHALIERLPLSDCSFDVAISNCVVNHCADKVRAFKEVYRVLKVGGRMCLSDLVASGPFSKAALDDELWGEWLAVAQSKSDYLRSIEQSGFQEVTIHEETAFEMAEKDERLKGRIISLTLTARKK